MTKEKEQAMKLIQVVTTQNTVNNAGRREVTDIYHKMQTPVVLTGLERTYQPRDEDGDMFPGESTRVQYSAAQALVDLVEPFSKMWNHELTKDVGNTKAFADVTVDGVVLLAQVPTTFLLYLEKQLRDFRSEIRACPTLDPALKWEWDAAANAWRSEPKTTTKTSKEATVITKAKATKEHAEQADLIYVDKVVGDWTVTNFSGALPAEVKKELLDRCDNLIVAVKSAREEANGIDVDKMEGADALFAYLLAPLEE